MTAREPSERALELLDAAMTDARDDYPPPWPTLRAYIAALEAIRDAAQRVHVQVLRRGWDEANEKLGAALAALTDGESATKRKAPHE